MRASWVLCSLLLIACGPANGNGKAPTSPEQLGEREDAALPEDQDVCLRGNYTRVIEGGKVVDGYIMVSLYRPQYSHNNYELNVFSRQLRVDAAGLAALKKAEGKDSWFMRAKGETHWTYLPTPDRRCPTPPQRNW